MKKKIRLKNSQEIGKIVLKKQRISSSFYNLYYLYNQPNTKIAIVAGKKCGGAIERNYLKRTMREIIRPNVEKFENIHAVLIAKEKALEISYTKKQDVINNMILQLLERIKKWEKLMLKTLRW